MRGKNRFCSGKGGILICGGIAGLVCYAFPGILLVLSVVLIVMGIVALP